MTQTSLKHWVLAARPKTLAASVMPVWVACTLAINDGGFRWVPALTCFLFAVIAQIVSNYLNDYYDFVKGSDRSDRLGPERAVAKGWIPPKTMLHVSIGMALVAGFLGCVLVYYCGWQLIFVGLFVGLGAYAYSGGPYPLAYRGWGDVCVLLFYGIIPVFFTYYTQTLTWNLPVLIAGISLGLVSVNILVANNYRDREQDKISKKNTTVVLFGSKFGEYFYLSNGIMAVLIGLFLLKFELIGAAFFPFLYLIPHWKTWKLMCRLHQGKELNKILAESARNTVIFGLLFIIGILISS